VTDRLTNQPTNQPTNQLNQTNQPTNQQASQPTKPVHQSPPSKGTFSSVTKFSALYGIRSFITGFTKTHHLSACSETHESSPCPPTYFFRPTLKVSFHLGLFPFLWLSLHTPSRNSRLFSVTQFVPKGLSTFESLCNIS